MKTQATPAQSASSQTLHRYSAEAVDRQIRKDKRIKTKRERNLIHALLRGRE